MMPSLENNNLENNKIPSLESNSLEKTEVPSLDNSHGESQAITATEDSRLENPEMVSTESVAVETLDTNDTLNGGYVANSELGEINVETLSLDDNLLNNGFQSIEKNNNNQEEPEKKKKSKLIPILLVILIIVLLMGGFIFYKIKFVKPDSFYNKLITSAFKTNIKTEGFNNFDTNIKVTTNDESLIALNDYSLNVKYQKDNQNAINYKAILKEIDNVLISLDLTYKDENTYITLDGLSEKTFSFNDIEIDSILENKDTDFLNNCLKYFANDLQKSIKPVYLTRSFSKATINGKGKYAFANILNINEGNVKSFLYDLFTNVKNDENLLNELAKNYKLEVIEIQDSLDNFIDKVNNSEPKNFNFKMIIYTNILTEKVEGFECNFKAEDILVNINGNENQYKFTLTNKDKLLLNGNVIAGANKNTLSLELVNEDKPDNNIKIEIVDEKVNDINNYLVNVTFLGKTVTLTMETAKKADNDITISKPETKVYNEITSEDIFEINTNIERIIKKTNFYKKVIKNQSNNTNTLIDGAQKLVEAAKNAMTVEVYDSSNVIKNGTSVCFDASWLYKNNNYIDEELKGSVLAKYIDGKYQYNVWITDEDNYLSNVNIDEITEDRIHEGSGSSSITKCSNSTIAEVECLDNEICKAK